MHAVEESVYLRRSVVRNFCSAVINYSIELAAAQMRFEVAHRSYQELLAKKSQQNH